MSRSLGSFPFRLHPHSAGHFVRAVIVSASLLATASCAGLPSVPTPTITPTSPPTETPRPTLTPTATSSPTPTPIPPFGSTAMALYQAEKFPFSIQIPADWGLTDRVYEPGREVSIYQGQDGSLVILQSIDLATVKGIPGEITLDDYLQLYLPELASGGINTEIVSNLLGTNAQGLPYRVVVNTEGMQFGNLKIVSTWVRLVTLHQGRTRFTAEYLAPTELTDEFLALIKHSFDTFRVVE